MWAKDKRKWEEERQRETERIAAEKARILFGVWGVGFRAFVSGDSITRYPSSTLSPFLLWGLLIKAEQ